MEVALINCPEWNVATPPLALAHLSGYLRAHGVFVSCFDLNNELFSYSQEKKLWTSVMEYFWFDWDLVEQFFLHHRSFLKDYISDILSNRQIKIMGFSLFNTSNALSRLVAMEVKALNPEVMIVFGGVDCYKHQAGKWLIEQPEVDYVVYGEGEEPFFELIAKICKGEEFSVRGILGKKEGKVVDHGERSSLPSLDSLPFSDFSDFDLFKYHSPDHLPINSSRGCIRRCTFCTEYLLSSNYRYRSGTSLFTEITHHLKQYPWVTQFDFYDSIINGNLKEFERFCDLLIENKVKIRWKGQAVIHPLMSRELCRKAKEAGCYQLSYGFESASSRVSRLMRKGFKIEDAESVLRNTWETGIETGLNFMFGFPGETEEDFRSNLEFVRRNKQYISCANPSSSLTGIDQGSYIYSHAERFNIRNNPHPMYWETLDGENTYPVRLRRFEQFCQHLRSLGVSSYYPHATLVNHYEALAEYFVYKEKIHEAIKHYQSSLKLEGENVAKLKRMAELYAKLGKHTQALQKIKCAMKLAKTHGQVPLPVRENLMNGLKQLKEEYIAQQQVFQQTAELPAGGEQELLDV